jgi:hypothetical protein
MFITAVDLYHESQPDFSRLILLGWDYAKAPQGVALSTILTLDIGRLRVSLIKEDFTANLARGKRPLSEHYTRIMLQPITDSGVPSLRGHGQPVSLAEAFDALKIVELMIAHAGTPL